MEMKVMTKEEKTVEQACWEGLGGITLALLIGAAIANTGCTGTVSILYHGKTPMGFENKQATALQAQPRVVKVREE